MKEKIILICLLMWVQIQGTYATVDWQHQTTQYVSIASTPNTANSYTWYEETDIEQGVHINLTPTEIVNIYVEKGNAKICFGHYIGPSSVSQYLIYLDVNVDNQGYVNKYTGSATSNYVWYCQSTFNTVKEYNLKVKFMVASSSTIYYREYKVQVVEASSKLFFDQYKNAMRMWESPLPNSTPLILSEGFDAYNIKPGQYYRKAGEDLFECLLNNGFDIYVLNYKYNAQDMRNNAAVYASAIDYISSINGNVDIVAAGMSMGGVISRYALAKAEDDGDPLPVKIWVSLDAPQQGAVISQDLQDFRKDHTSDPFEEYASDNVAAKQLLTYNAYDANGTIHTNFYNDLNSLNGNGYPHLTRNIGVAFSTDSPNPNTGTWLSVTYSLGTLEDFDLTTEEKVAGSYLPKLNIDPSMTMVAWGIFWTNVTITQYSYPTFIPHTSSLDIVSGSSKFDRVITPDAGYFGFHDVVPDDIIDELINEVLYGYHLLLQNQTITTTKEFRAIKTIRAGYNVNPNKPNGNFVVDVGADVDFIAGESIGMEQGFSVNTGARFSAIIQSTPEVSCSASGGLVGFSEETTYSQNQEHEAINESYGLESQEFSGINEDNLVAGSQIKVYPNPSSGICNLEFSDSYDSKNIELINAQGKTIYTKKDVRGNKVVLDLSAYPQGIYFIKVKTATTQFTEKIMIE